MACEQNILDLPLSGVLPSDDDVVIMTAADGTTVLRYWSVLKSALSAAQKKSVTVPDGVLYNLPAGTLLKYVVYAGTGSPVLDIGLTSGGDELVSAWVANAATTNTQVLNRYLPSAATLYVTGLSGTQNLILYYE